MSSDISSTPSISRSSLAGGAVGVFETITLGQILNRIQVAQEADPSRKKIRETICSIYQKGGWRELYQGLRWNSLLSAIKGAGGWGIYNFYNREFNVYFPHENSPFQFSALVACSTAITETTFPLCPLERLKIFEMTRDPRQKFEVIQSIRKGGIPFLYRGWNFMVFKRTWGWINYLEVYRHLRHSLLASNQQQPLTLSQKFILGCGTGGIVACLNSPMDLIKTQIQKEGTPPSEKALSLALSVFKQYGWAGMFRGLKIKIVRSTWMTTVGTLALDHFDALPKNMKI